jgi:hypothetical protein
MVDYSNNNDEDKKNNRFNIKQQEQTRNKPKPKWFIYSPLKKPEMKRSRKCIYSVNQFALEKVDNGRQQQQQSKCDTTSKKKHEQELLRMKKNLEKIAIRNLVSE